MEWLREENRGLTRMTFLSGVMLLTSVTGAVVSRLFASGHLPDLLIATSVLFAFVLGSAIATERAVIAQSVRTKHLEDRLASLEEKAVQHEAPKR